MTEEEPKIPVLFYLAVGTILVVVCGVAGTILYFNWGKLGLPTAGEFTEELVAARSGEVPGATVVEGNAANYLKYVNRDDIIVMVNFYSRQDQLAGDVELALKRLSARYEGKLVLMNVDVLQQAKLVSQIGVGTPPDVHLMHAGDRIGRCTKESRIPRLGELVEARLDSLGDPVEQAASEVNPYAESLRSGNEFVPEGVAPQ